MDLEIREFKNAIVQFVNKSDLPMEIKRLCLSEILKDVSDASDVVIKDQLVSRSNLESEANKNAESVQPDWLGKLSKW